MAEENKPKTSGNTEATKPATGAQAAKPATGAQTAKPATDAKKAKPATNAKKAKPAKVKKAKPAKVKKAKPAKPAKVKKAKPAKPAKPAKVKKAKPAKPAKVKKAKPAKVAKKREPITGTMVVDNFKVQWSKFSTLLGRIGKSLLFPIATLPIAAILLRVGAQLPDDIAFAHFVKSIFQTGGNAVFNYLPLIFAVGIGFGLTKDNRGEAALSALIGMIALNLIMGSGDGHIDLTDQIYGKTGAYDFHGIFMDKYDNILSENVLNGFIAGGLVAFIYNKFNGVELPSVLGFFSGRRLIPVLTIITILLFGILYAIIFPWIGYILYKLSDALGSAQGNRYSNAGIMFAYGILNRLLLPFGMHHIPNTIFWFTLGTHHDALGQAVNGDINIFLNGVPAGNTGGTFQSGFFPIMMFGIPAIAAAFYFTAESKEQKRRILAIFGSAAAVSFLTGITEPLEFAFLFASPALFALHAFLTGIFGFITGLFGIQLGFGFSAGLFDYLLSIPKSMAIINAHSEYSTVEEVFANPGWIVVIGAVAATVYFFLFKFIITKFDLATPGRGEGKIASPEFGESHAVNAPSGGFSPRAKAIVAAYGGWDNITSYQNCATRLRYDVKDSSLVDEKALKKAGIVGVMKVSKTHVQSIVGPKVEILNNEIVANKGKTI